MKCSSILKLHMSTKYSDSVLHIVCHAVRNVTYGGITGCFFCKCPITNLNNFLKNGDKSKRFSLT